MNTAKIINEDSTKTMVRKLKSQDYEHCLRVANISFQFALFIGEDIKSCNEILTAGLLHDIGKSRIPNAILQKPGRLTIKERRIIRKHVFYSADYVKSVGLNPNITEAVLYHHENYDGTGYQSLAGENIPTYARIIRICDVYDALTSDRPYRIKLTNSYALKIMKEEKHFFDPNLYDQFLPFIQKFYI